MLTFTLTICAADYEKSGRTKIARIGAYHSSTAGGDIIITVDNPSLSCKAGYILEKDTAGLAPTLSVLLSAFHANSVVDIHAHTTRSWRGSSSSNWCIVEAVHLLK